MRRMSALRHDVVLMSGIGTLRQLLRRGAMSGVGGEPDSITDGLDQTLPGNAEVYAWLNSRARSRQPSV
jgi:hypothetical protein